MSGVVIVDARYATGQAGRVLRAAQRDGGVYDREWVKSRLATLVPVDSLRDADLALVRVSDGEWVVVKNVAGGLGATVGPEEVSEILAVQRRRELGLDMQVVDWSETRVTTHGQETRDAIQDAADITFPAVNGAGVLGGELIADMLEGRKTWDEIKWPYAAELLRDMIDTGQVTPNGADITLDFAGGEGLTFPAVRGSADVRVPADPIDRGDVKRADGAPRPLKHANDAYVRAENERLAQQGLTPQDARRIAAQPGPAPRPLAERDSFWFDPNKMRVVDDRRGNA